MRLSPAFEHIYSHKIRISMSAVSRSDSLLLLVPISRNLTRIKATLRQLKSIQSVLSSLNVVYLSSDIYFDRENLETLVDRIDECDISRRKTKRTSAK